jgi:hypothetical protein
LSIAPDEVEMRVALMKEPKVRRRKEKMTSRWNREDFILASGVVEIRGFTRVEVVEEFERVLEVFVVELILISKFEGELQFC